MCAYYPKSRIILGRIANPGEFTFPDGISYSGDYYMTFDGKYYTGKNPQSTHSSLIVKIGEILNGKMIPLRNNITYNRIKGNIDILDFEEPSSYYPTPTPEDYKIGKITRYFAKQRISRKFKMIEINKFTYDDIDQEKGQYNYPMWKVTSLFWQISGPLYDERPNGQVVRAGVIDTNQRIVEQKDKVFFGIKQYLTDFKQFYKS